MFKIYEALGTQSLWFKYSKYKKIIELVLDSFDAIKDRLGGTIVHAYHGADYSSKVYKKILINIMQFNRRLGLDIKHMSFVQLKQAITDYIYYYNNIRFKEKLGWMNPTQFDNQL